MKREDITSQSIQLKVKKVEPGAIVPKYQTLGAACFDLHAFGEVEPVTLNSEARYAHTFRTGLKFEIQPGWVMMIFSRSGHGFNNDIRLANCVGIVDSDYRGEVSVKLTADDTGYLVVKEGDRIAQAMLMRADQVAICEVDELSETARGEGGFGSTGA